MYINVYYVYIYSLYSFLSLSNLRPHITWCFSAVVIQTRWKMNRKKAFADVVIPIVLAFDLPRKEILFFTYIDFGHTINVQFTQKGRTKASADNDHSV